MILVLLLYRSLASVSADPAPPRPPVSVEVQAGLLSWVPGAEQGGVTFTVQSRPFNEDTWRDVSSCVQTEDTSCDVKEAERGAEHGCVQLRVRAQRGGLQSKAVEACGRGGPCTPQLNLSALPGSLTVHLSRAHALWEEFADHARHRVCVSRPGQPQQQCRDSLSSLTFSDLLQGHTYCASVQFLSYSRPEGSPSCAACRDVPRAPSRHGGLALGLAVPGLVLGLAFAVAYVLIFHREKLKLWLKPPRLPDTLSLPQGALVPAGGALMPIHEEHCSIIDAFTELNSA